MRILKGLNNWTLSLLRHCFLILPRAYSVSICTTAGRNRTRAEPGDCSAEKKQTWPLFKKPAF